MAPRVSAYPMVEVREALETILAKATPLGVETVELTRARGRILAEDITADFVYCRLHGAEQLYVSGYSDAELDWWADRVNHWRKGKQPKAPALVSTRKAAGGRRDVYVYFDNDAKVHAPFNAKTLLGKLKGAQV